MILNDKQIKEQVGMITPFYDNLISTWNGRKVISFGLSSFGYDVRLSGKDFRVFRRIPEKLVDPKNFDKHNLEVQRMHNDEYFILPAHTYALGVSYERFEIPSDTIAIAIGKSTYARAGIIVNVTPLEPGWKGYLTIEVSNSSHADCKIYPYEGILQLVFLKGEECLTPYNRKYQNQKNEVTLPR